MLPRTQMATSGSSPAGDMKYKLLSATTRIEEIVRSKAFYVVLLCSMFSANAHAKTYILSMQSHLSQAALGKRSCKVFRPNLTKMFHVHGGASARPGAIFHDVSGQWQVTK
jgi:hypothetical protein